MTKRTKRLTAIAVGQMPLMSPRGEFMKTIDEKIKDLYAALDALTGDKRFRRKYHYEVEGPHCRYPRGVKVLCDLGFRLWIKKEPKIKLPFKEKK